MRTLTEIVGAGLVYFFAFQMGYKNSMTVHDGVKIGVRAKAAIKLLKDFYVDPYTRIRGAAEILEEP